MNGCAPHGFSSSLHKPWHLRHKLLMIAEHRVARCHVNSCILARYGIRYLIWKSMECDEAINFPEQFLIEWMVKTVMQITVGSKVVCHFLTFEQRLSYWPISQLLLKQCTGIINRESGTLYTAAVTRKEYGGVVIELRLAHRQNNIVDIVLCQGVVFRYFFLKYPICIFAPLSATVSCSNLLADA